METARQLEREINQAILQLNIVSQLRELEDLMTQSEQANFWEDSQKAAIVMQRIAKLDNKIKPWLNLQSRVVDLVALAELGDIKLANEIVDDIEASRGLFNDLRQQLEFAGPYDDHGAIVNISAGAGGTDAQDWTQMLFRMYSRYCELKGWKLKLIEESAGEEAGLKSVIIEVDGADFVYGRLKSEQGVHRLVRLSPFNSDNLRQTSFAKVEVSPMITSPTEVDIDDKELKIDVFRSGGHGGQSVNTTDSAVRITHLPTGIAVAIQNERSQLQNKETALTILRSRLAQLQIDQHAQELSDIKGPNQSAEWGNQIRSYVLHPYKQVKDLRTKYETSDIDGVLNGQLEPFIKAYLENTLGQ